MWLDGWVGVTLCTTDLKHYHTHTRMSCMHTHAQQLKGECAKLLEEKRSAEKKWAELNEKLTSSRTEVSKTGVPLVCVCVCVCVCYVAHNTAIFLVWKTF